MSRCELHTEGPLANQCQRAAVLGILAVHGQALDTTAEWVAQACAEHAWEAVAIAARQVGRLRSAGRDDARVVAVVEEAGEQLLELLHGGVTIGDRWPLAKPWAARS